MRNYLLALLVAAICLFASCKKSPEEVQLTRVNLSCSGFTLSQEDMKAHPAGAGIEFIVIAVYDDQGTSVAQLSQYRGDYLNNLAAFGDFTFALSQGSYYIMAIGYWADQTLTPITITDTTLIEIPNRSRCHKTYSGRCRLTITGQPTATVQVDMSQAVAGFTLRPTDAIPDNIQYISCEYSNGSGTKFNPLTLLSPENVGSKGTYAVTAAQRASAEPTCNFFSFLNTQEQTMSVKLSAVSFDGDTLYQREFHDVPMKLNRRVVARGNFFTSNNTTAFNFQEWSMDEDYIIDF